MRRWDAWIVGFLAFAAVPRGAWAQAADPRVVQPERPSVATHAYTVAPGILEIEAGYERSREGGRFSVSGSSVTGKLGLAARLQFSGSVSSTWRAGGGDGLDEIGAALKWRIADRAPGAGAIAVLPSVRVAAGPERKFDETTVGVVLVASRPVGAVSLDLNLGYGQTSSGGRVPDTETVVWAVSLGGPLVGRFGWLAELSGVRTTPADDTAAHVATVIVGGTVSMARSLAVDVALVLPETGPEGRAFVTGLSWNALRLWSR